MTAVDPDMLTGFLAAIAAAPEDDLPKLVLADWLDERMDPAGEGLRVAVQRGWRPDKLILTRSIDWYFWFPLRRPRANSCHHLPAWLFTALPGWDEPPADDWVQCETAADAWQKYIDAWREAVMLGRWPRLKSKRSKVTA
jgi:uncharacterized protein (TIGR02996 family)